MKKLSILCIIILLGSLYLSCKKDDMDAINSPLDISKSDIAKITPLLSEANELFNSGNQIIASTKAEQAKMIFNAVFVPGRKVIVSAQCPLKMISSDESLALMALSCGGFTAKQPANVRGVFNDNMMIFTVPNDKVRGAAAGSMFTGTLEIMDPGVLMEAEEGFLYSYSINFNAKIIEIEKAGK